MLFNTINSKFQNLKLDIKIALKFNIYLYIMNMIKNIYIFDKKYIYNNILCIQR